MNTGNPSDGRTEALTDQKLVTERVPAKGNPKILLVDDEKDIALAFKLGLQSRGMDVSAFTDPLMALEDLKKRHYDLVITDVRMPWLSGFELYREIRKHDKDIPIVFLTGFEISQSELTEVFPDVKPKALLSKPIRISELASVVSQILAGKN